MKATEEKEKKRERERPPSSGGYTARLLHTKEKDLHLYIEKWRRRKNENLSASSIFIVAHRGKGSARRGEGRDGRKKRKENVRLSLSLFPRNGGKKTKRAPCRREEGKYRRCFPSPASSAGRGKGLNSAGRKKGGEKRKEKSTRPVGLFARGRRGRKKTRGTDVPKRRKNPPKRGRARFFLETLFEGRGRKAEFGRRARGGDQ